MHVIAAYRLVKRGCTAVQVAAVYHQRRGATSLVHVADDGLARIEVLTSGALERKLGSS